MLPALQSKTIPTTLRSVSLRLYAQVLIVTAFTLISLPMMAVQAQEPEDEVLTVNTDLLVFPIRVRDKRGATLLTERDLLLRDEDKVTSGVYLYPGADRVALVFALDESGSLREIISQQREAALALFGRFGERSRVAVIRFSEKPMLVAPFSRDALAASEAFRFGVQANRHTAILDAAAAAVGAFDTLPRVRSERRIVILISDGLDNASRARASAVINAARQKRVSFYVIHLPLFQPRDGRLVVRTPIKGFRALAEETGGKYFLVGNVKSALSPTDNRANDLSEIFQAIEDDLRSQYLLGFYAGESSRDGRNHRLRVSLPAGVEYRVEERGYSRTHEFSVNLMRREQKVVK